MAARQPVTKAQGGLLQVRDNPIDLPEHTYSESGQPAGQTVLPSRAGYRVENRRSRRSLSTRSGTQFKETQPDNDPLNEDRTGLSDLRRCPSSAGHPWRQDAERDREGRNTDERTTEAEGTGEYADVHRAEHEAEIRNR